MYGICIPIRASPILARASRRVSSYMPLNQLYSLIERDNGIRPSLVLGHRLDFRKLIFTYANMVTTALYCSLRMGSQRFKYNLGDVSLVSNILWVSPWSESDNPFPVNYCVHRIRPGLCMEVAYTKWLQFLNSDRVDLKY